MSSERLGICSMVVGITGIVCDLFYPPMSLAYNQITMSADLVCGVIGILLAPVAKNADMSLRRTFNAKAIAGLVLSATAITFIFFFPYALINCYEAPSNPATGPRIDGFINRLQKQLNQQVQLPRTTGFTWFQCLLRPY